jgi:hypothetical protein
MTTSNDTSSAENDKQDESWWDKAVDSVEDTFSGVAHGVADVFDDVPVIGSIAEAGADVVDLGTEVGGGILKGAGTFVDGVATMVEHPIDTLKGLEGMAEHIPVVGNVLKAAHDGIDAAVDGKDVWGAVEQDFDLSQSLEEDGAYWEKVGGALIDPYEKEIEEGKGAEAFGRGIFDIGSNFITGGEAFAAEGAVDATRVGEMAAHEGEVAEACSFAGRGAEREALPEEELRM